MNMRNQIFGCALTILVVLGTVNTSYARQKNGKNFVNRFCVVKTIKERPNLCEGLDAAKCATILMDIESECINSKLMPTVETNSQECRYDETVMKSVFSVQKGSLLSNIFGCLELVKEVKVEARDKEKKNKANN